MPYTTALVLVVAGYTWVVDPLMEVRGVWRQMPTLLVIGITVLKAIRSGEWGFSRRAFLPALAWVMAITVPVAIGLYAIGGTLGTRQTRTDVWLDLLYLIFWGGGQQLALQTVVLREAQRAMGTAAIPVAAAIFAALHLPNPFLTGLTFAGALVWCAIYARYPNILPLSLSHAIVTVAVLVSFDDATTGHLRIGWRYLGNP